MFENIEKIIREAGELRIEKTLYGTEILIGVDFNMLLNNAVGDEDATLIYSGIEVYRTLHKACSAETVETTVAREKLNVFSKIHSEFLFASGDSLESALYILEQKAALWLQAPKQTQSTILLDFVKYIEN